jgi:hypothetical protein
MSAIEDKRQRLEQALRQAESAAADWYWSVRTEVHARLADQVRTTTDDTVRQARTVLLNLLEALDEAKRGVSP